MWLKWLPWRYLVGQVAQAHGFLDPISVLTRFYRFAQPAEIAEPLELLRAGVAFHARGLMNTAAIQHNLDWVWPFWVERQFDPLDIAFIPRGFSLTHINLTHRNWTAVGLPDLDALPLVDPRGLLTPHLNGWSLDGWLVAADRSALIPSRSSQTGQRLELERGVALVTQSRAEGLELSVRAAVERHAGGAWCRQTYNASADRPAWFVLALRPYNPEGVSFIHRVRWEAGGRAWTVDNRQRIHFSPAPDRHRMSRYRSGDVFGGLPEGDERREIECDVGMATSAALFALQPGTTRRVELAVHLGPERAPTFGLAARRRSLPTRAPNANTAEAWDDALAGQAQLRIAQPRLEFLYQAALRTLILLTPGEIYAGPYTYKRFWVRDAVMILNALLSAGLVRRAGRVLPSLLARQTGDGYFLSQEGEWDSNGEALWILGRYCALAGHAPPAAWRQVVGKAGRWIMRKRLRTLEPLAHAGLLPAGFSAEHLGPNDYYYWDDFWSVAGLRQGAFLLEALERGSQAAMFREEADDLLAAVDRSLASAAARLGRRAMPASPYRRMDSGAIGSLAAGYPLELFAAHDPRLIETADWLRRNCMVHGGFFQDMIHSGVNAYLTLHIAQVLMRAGDPSWSDLLGAIAGLASQTGQWPEAIHPHTGGGCMGDGQHAWAAAEWIMALRNAFVREEADRLVLGAGIPAPWLAGGAEISFGPAPTPWGPITVALRLSGGQLSVDWEGQWRGASPPVEVAPPGFQPQSAAGQALHLSLCPCG